MPKTVFTDFMILNATHANGFNNPRFDDLDLDGHNPRLTNDSLSNAAGNIKPEFASLRDSLKVVFVSVLTVKVLAGFVIKQNGQKVIIAETQLTVPNNASRIIYVDSNGALQQSSTAPEIGILLALVISSGGVVSTIDDLRARVGFQIAPITTPVTTQFTMPPGVSMAYIGAIAPAGWLLEDGSEYLKTQYPALAALFEGLPYQPTDNTKFRLPDKRDRSLIGASVGNGINNYGGENIVSVPVPLHNHGINDPSHAHSMTDLGHSHAIYDVGHAHTTALRMGGTDAGTGNNITDNSTAGDHDNVLTSSTSGTGVGIYPAGANVAVNAGATGITVNNAGYAATMDVRSKYITTNFIIKT